MEINDETIDAARNSLIESSGKTYFPSNYQIRAALGAALGATRWNASDLVNSLIGWANVLEISSGKFVNEDCRKAAACIEDLAGALKKTNARLYRLCECESESGCKDAALRDKNSATLERWGLK